MRQTKSNARQNVTKHLGARTIKIPINNVKKLTGIGFLPASEAPRKTHMAYRKKYKALILKYLKNNVLKNRKNQPFPNDVWAILFRIAACIIQGFRHNRVAKQ